MVYSKGNFGTYVSLVKRHIYIEKNYLWCIIIRHLKIFCYMVFSKGNFGTYVSLVKRHINIKRIICGASLSDSSYWTSDEIV